MRESTYIPQGKLSLYVELIWHGDEYSPPARKERVLPSGSSQLIINLGANRFRHFEGTEYKQIREYDHTIIAGIHSSFIFLDATTRISTMGIVFRPGGIRALFGLPANEVQDQIISLSDVTGWGSAIPALRQRLMEAEAPEEKFSIVDSFLSGLLNRDFQPNPAILFAARQLNSEHGIQPVSEIVEKTGYSRRRLSDLFKDTVGTTPKQYARIRRFQYVLGAIRNSAKPDWSRLALNCGYYDQAHFNHDFHALSGLTPTQYFRNQTGKRNHLPV